MSFVFLRHTGTVERNINLSTDISVSDHLAKHWVGGSFRNMKYNSTGMIFTSGIVTDYLSQNIIFFYFWFNGVWFPKLKLL